MITKICKENGLLLNNKMQKICNLTIYPREYFCPINYKIGELCISDNTYAIHHFDGSWLSEKQIEERDRNRFLCKKCGIFQGEKYGKLESTYRQGGLNNVLRKIILRLFS